MKGKTAAVTMKNITKKFGPDISRIFPSMYVKVRSLHCWVRTAAEKQPL